jgi:hypothetical protein
MFSGKSFKLAIAALLAAALAGSDGFAQGPPGGGGYPGGGGGRRGGGGGGRGFDPGAWFDMRANGRTSVPISEFANPRDPDASQLQAWAAQQGITGGQINRDQFSQYLQERMAARGAGGPGGGRRGGGGGPGSTPPGPSGAPGVPSEGGAAPGGAVPQGAPVPPEEEEKPVTFHRPGKLPKGIPDWFAKLDTDNDGQVGLYEWKEAGRSLEEFRKIDRNGDGFITVDEAMRVAKANVPAGKSDGGNSARSGDESAEESSSNRIPVAVTTTNDNTGDRADRPSRRSGGGNNGNRQWSNRGNGGGRKQGGGQGNGGQRGGNQGGQGQDDSGDN